MHHRKTVRVPDSRRPFALATLATLTLLACVASAQAQRRCMVALLTGGQETPPNATTAFGCGVVIIDVPTGLVSYRVAYGGLSTAETAAHIHGSSGPGVPSGVMIGLPAGNPKVGSFVATPAQLTALLSGNTYFNIHTVAFGGGEIRGQIVDAVALLDGRQETPAVATAARGVGLFMINTTTNTLNYYISYGGLSSAETAAHIHGLAIHGTPAGVLVPLPAGNPKIGAWVYPEALERAICRGQTYVNIHTVNFGGGEIRGQITGTVVPLDGLQETPPVAAPGSAGCGLISFDEANNIMGYDFAYVGLPTGETAAHIHGFSPPGVPSGVLVPLPAGPRKLGTWTYGPAAEPRVFQGLTYANIHSVAFGGGEIRGQIAPWPWTCPGLRGDANCDGLVDFFDIDPFLEAIFSEPTYVTTFCSGSLCAADANCDGLVDFFDIDPFLNCVFNGCPPCP